MGLIMKYEKYVSVRIWPTRIYGSSAGRAPIHVNNNILITSVQNIILFIG